MMCVRIGSNLSFCALCLLLLVSGCGDEPEEAPVIRPVRYVMVESTDAASQRVFSGVAKAGQESRLSFQVSGQVLSVPIRVGDTVKKDQTIARIDPADYQLQLQNAQASASQARAQERNAKATYERTRALYENQNASRQDLDADRTSYESARAAMSSANQQVRLLQRQLDYTHLKAPDDGTIATVDVEANENVSPGQLVATLLVGEQIEVSVSVPGSAIRRIERGDEVRVAFDDLGAQELPGVVSEVGVASVSGRTTFPVTIRLMEGEASVRAGMAADVTFIFERAPDAPEYVLPISAVGEDGEGRFVFVLEKAADELGIVHRRAVQVGKLTSNGIEIREGVRPGELVVTAGVSRIYEGLEVRVPEAEQPEAEQPVPAPADQAETAEQQP